MPMPTRRRRFPTRRRISQMYQRVNRKAIHGAECSEDEHQEAFFSWVDDTAALQTDPVKRLALEFLHHIPNGKGRGQRIVTATASLPPPDAFRLKMMGVRPGVLDIRLDFPATFPGAHTDFPEEYHGLLIEFKSGTGKLSTEQIRYQRFMEGQGVICQVRRTWQGAARSVAGYMSLGKIAPVFIKGDDRYVTTITDPAILQGLEAIKE